MKHFKKNYKLVKNPPLLVTIDHCNITVKELLNTEYNHIRFTPKFTFIHVILF